MIGFLKKMFGRKSEADRITVQKSATVGKSEVPEPELVVRTRRRTRDEIKKAKRRGRLERRRAIRELKRRGLVGSGNRLFSEPMLMIQEPSGGGVWPWGPVRSCCPPPASLKVAGLEH